MSENDAFDMSKLNLEDPATTAMISEMIRQGLHQAASACMPAPQFETLTEEETKLPLSDGVSLNVYLVRPAAEGKYPVILVRNPYVINDISYRGLLPAFAGQGYVCVLVSVRGALTSEGEWFPMIHERADGRETLDWVAAQDWCDGNIGGFGASYLGYTQWSIADYHHPALKTLFIEVSGASAYHTFWRRGMFRQEIWTQWAMQMMEDNRRKMIVSPELCKEAFRFQPQLLLGEHYKNVPCEWYKIWVSSALPTDPFWSEGYWGELEKAVEDIQIPVMLQGGWFDIFLRPQLDAFRRLPESVRERSRFLIGPWNHGGTPVGDFPHEN